VASRARRIERAVDDLIESGEQRDVVARARRRAAQLGIADVGRFIELVDFERNLAIASDRPPPLRANANHFSPVDPWEMYLSLERANASYDPHARSVLRLETKAKDWWNRWCEVWSFIARARWDDEPTRSTECPRTSRRAAHASRIARELAALGHDDLAGELSARELNPMPTIGGVLADDMVTVTVRGRLSWYLWLLPLVSRLGAKRVAVAVVHANEQWDTDPCPTLAADYRRDRTDRSGGREHGVSRLAHHLDVEKNRLRSRVRDARTSKPRRRRSGPRLTKRA
jgi:hypothetical protein